MEELVFTSGGTEANNFAIKRMPLRNIDIFLKSFYILC